MPANPVDVARLFLHIREAGPNTGQRVEAIQKWSGGIAGQSWCCYFVTMVLDLCYGGTSPIPRQGACQGVYDLAKQNKWVRQPRASGTFTCMSPPLTTTRIILALSRASTRWSALAATRQPMARPAMATVSPNTALRPQSLSPTPDNVPRYYRSFCPPLAYLNKTPYIWETVRTWRNDGPAIRGGQLCGGRGMWHLD